MKHIKRLFLLLIAFTLTFLVTSCKSTVYNFAGKTFAEIDVLDKDKLIGVLLIKDVTEEIRHPYAQDDQSSDSIIDLVIDALYGDEYEKYLKEAEVKNIPSGKFYKLYQKTYQGTLPDGEYVLVYEAQDANLYPSIKANGKFYAGVYMLNDLNLTRINEVNSSKVVYVRVIGFGDALLMSIICILIVFLILIIISLIVSLFKFKKQIAPSSPNALAPTTSTDTNILLEDIKDPDMMAAALVASIDYHEEIKEDVKIKSIKEIK